MRRGLNPQIPEYVQDGELICFGVSDHVVKEAQPIWTDKAVRDLNVVSYISSLITVVF